MTDSTVGVGIIGLGARGFFSIGLNTAQSCRETGFRITALCDRNPSRAAEARDALGRVFDGLDVDFAPRLYTTGQDVIEDEAVDLVVITSVTDTHRQFAVPALRSGKKVYCDKPLAQNAEEAVAIVEAEAATQNPMIMGFTRRYEAPWRRAFELLQDGAVGELTMIHVRDIIPYHRYLMAWWRRRKWSGGALSDKGCHLFDVFNWFARGRAVRVHGFGGREVIKADLEAPFRCSECDRECSYRRRTPAGLPDARAPDVLAHHGESWLSETQERHMDDVCIFRPGADVFHNGSIHFSYDNGVIATYTYSLFGPRAHDQETLELVGTTGRLLLTRQTATIDLLREQGERHEVIDCRGEAFGGTHFGADQALIREMRGFCDGAQPRVSARDGLEATRMAMAALKSMDGGDVVVHMDEIPDAGV
jgi:predicted dehydrogenase